MMRSLPVGEMELPPRVKNLAGSTFYDLEVVQFKCLGKQGAIWSCKCQCGQDVEVYAGDLKSGNTRSCGCRRARQTRERSTTHGQTSGKHHTKYPRCYKIWRSMLNRCHTKSSSAYLNYGGRGIQVCDRWRKSFEKFYEDMGEPLDGFTIERIDVNKGYSKENCTWTPLSEQSKNKRNTVRVLLNGEEMIQAEAARRLGLHPSTLCDWHKGRSSKPLNIDLVFIDQAITQ